MLKINREILTNILENSKSSKSDMSALNLKAASDGSTDLDEETSFIIMKAWSSNG